MLRRVFDTAPIKAITPQHIARYRDERGAPVRANRELALLSYCFNFAREWGYTSQDLCLVGQDAANDGLNDGFIAAGQLHRQRAISAHPACFLQITPTLAASKLLGHTKQKITKKVCVRVGENVKPTR